MKRDPFERILLEYPDEVSLGIESAVIAWGETDAERYKDIVDDLENVRVPKLLTLRQSDQLENALTLAVYLGDWGLSSMERMHAQYCLLRIGRRDIGQNRVH